MTIMEFLKTLSKDNQSLPVQIMGSWKGTVKDLWSLNIDISGAIFEDEEGFKFYICNEGGNK